MPRNIQKNIIQISDNISRLNIPDALQALTEIFPEKITFSSSFSMEDQVITDYIVKSGASVSIFTLDTGRLFAETYSVWAATNEKYSVHIKAYYPEHQELEAFVNKYGPNAFYESTENRKQCCHLRKVEPLKRALKGNEVWITGLRAEHSPERKDLETIEWDATNKIVKYNPLLHWKTREIKEYISNNNIPYNILHDKGFESIGCAPCTRAIKPGEDFRAGRWWWEELGKKECGLHLK